MINAKLHKLKRYFDADTFEIMDRFLDSVNEDTPDGEYVIMGKEIFARVMTYKTNQAEKCVIEAHDHFIDIQFTLRGAEGISVFDREDLEEINKYNETTDVIFFRSDNSKIIAHTDNIPGYFTLLYPDDAHRPGEKIRGIDEVKKVVIKVKIQGYYA